MVFITVFLNFVIAGCGSPDKKNDKKTETIQKEKIMPAVQKTLFNSENIIFKAPFTVLSKSYSGWQLSSAPRYFNASNLSDLINGASESYIDFGFIKLVTADYKNSKSDQQTVTIEVYDMKTSKGAFGRFSRFLSNLKDPAKASGTLKPPLEKIAINGDGDLLFWKNHFLVHLAIMDENPEATVESINKTASKILPAAARSIFNAINGASELPKDLTLFPKDNLIKQSYAIEAKKLLGYDALKSGYSARYKNGDIAFTMFFTDQFSLDKEAVNVAKEVAGRNPKPVVIKASSKRVAGVLNDGEKDISKDFYEKLFNKLIENIKNQDLSKDSNNRKIETTKK